MTDNTSQIITDLLTEAAESIIDFATFTITAAQSATEQIKETKDIIMKISEKIREENIRNEMKLEEEIVVDVLHYVMSAIVGPIVCLLGIVGNLISIITWSRAGMRGSTGRYLTGQAIANVAVLLMFVLCDSIHYWSPNVKYSPIYGAFFSYFGYPIFHLAVICSIWITVGVTVDRYLMVCWITRAKRLCSESRATFGLFLITLNGFIINIPHFVSFTPVYSEHSSNNHQHNDVSTIATKIQVAYTLTEFSTGQGGKIYEFWIHCILMILIPWVSVFFMNMMIITKINKANKRMADKKTAQSMKKSRESENQITRILLAVTFTFLFFLGIQCITQCLWMKQPPGANLILVSGTFAFGKTGILFNSSMNFLLYCLTGRRFRLELLKMVGLAKQDTLLSSLMDTSSSNISTTNTTATSTNEM